MIVNIRYQPQPECSHPGQQPADGSDPMAQDSSMALRSAGTRGRYPGDPPRYSGRRVDLLGRSLPAGPGADPADVLRRYLAARRTDSAKALAAKAVALIHPENRVGEIVWPVTHMS